MNNLLSDPQFIAALIAFIVAITSWLNSVLNKRSIDKTKSVVDWHTKQLNGGIDKRTTELISAGIQLYDAAHTVPNPADIKPPVKLE